MGFSCLWVGRVTAALAMIVIALAGSASAGSPFGSIVASDSAEYEVYQVKVTYLGIQTVVPPSLMLTGAGRSPSLSEFVPHQTAGIEYDNDDIYLVSLSVAGASINKIVDAIAVRPLLQTTTTPENPIYSIMIDSLQNEPGRSKPCDAQRPSCRRLLSHGRALDHLPADAPPGASARHRGD